MNNLYGQQSNLRRIFETKKQITNIKKEGKLSLNYSEGAKYGFNTRLEEQVAFIYFYSH